MNTFIITAGGIGKRMGTTLPKQFLLLHGKPILLWTLERFHEADPKSQILLTLPKEWFDYWNELLKKNNCTIPHQLVTGGVERYDSIKNALSVATGEVIGVHDGVRPLVAVATIKECMLAAKKHGSGVPFLPVKESLRYCENGISTAVNRSQYILIQTPQCFSATILLEAYQHAFHASITDDASLVEEAGFPIQLVEGNEENIKITTPFDLQVAASYLNN